MQRSTIKTVFLIIGSAVGGILIFVAAGIAFLYYKLYSGDFSTPPRWPKEKVVSNVPSIVEKERFLGSHGVYLGDFSSNGNNVLAGGPGRLLGRVSANGKPVAGLRLRLALNGEIMSQWGTSDSEGRYEISVPFAKYRIDGYVLDSETANRVLKGKIDNPGNSSSSEVLAVAEGRPGRGLDLDFVDPVRKTAPLGDVSIKGPIIAVWQAYPGAVAYRLQLLEQKDPRNLMDEQRLFAWNKQPKVTTTSVNLNDLGIPLKTGYYYTVELDALDSNGRTLSSTPRMHGRPDFWLTE